MKRFQIGLAALAVGAASFGSGALGSAPHASAAGDHAVGKVVLDTLCRASGGTAVTTPFAIARCQEARPQKGFELERLICDGLLGGRFSGAPSHNRPSRTTWACFFGPA